MENKAFGKNWTFLEKKVADSRFIAAFFGILPRKNSFGGVFITRKDKQVARTLSSKL